MNYTEPGFRTDGMVKRQHPVRVPNYYVGEDYEAARELPEEIVRGYARHILTEHKREAVLMASFLSAWFLGLCMGLIMGGQ